MKPINGQLAPVTPVAEATYLTRITHHLRASWRIWLLGLVIIGGLTGVFVGLAGEVLEKEAFAWDAPIMLTIHQYSRPWLDTLMIAITKIGFPGALVIAPILVAWLWWRQRQTAAVALVVSVVGAALLSSSLKLLFARPRSSVFPPVTAETTFSFPSGHTLGAVALYGFAAYLLWQHKERLWAMLALFFALLVSFSRIYLGVHYPSDILGAICVGLLWLPCVIGGYRYVQASSSATEKSETYR